MLPSERVIDAIGGARYSAEAALRAWFGDQRALAVVLESVAFDVRAREIAESGPSLPERHSDPRWVIGHAAYQMLSNTPAAFVVQFAMACSTHDQWLRHAMMNNPGARNALWRALRWAGNAPDDGQACAR